MIVIEPAIAKKFGRASLRKRELEGVIAQAAERAGLSGAISVLLTGDEAIRELNREFRHKDKATDVLSFPAMEMSGPGRVAGDLAISVETAAREAENRGHALMLELKILLLHGVLHLAGFDHETDSGQMARREKALRAALGLSEGLIERAGRGSGIKKNGAKESPRASAGAKGLAAKSQRTQTQRDGQRKMGQRQSGRRRGGERP